MGAFLMIGMVLVRRCDGMPVGRVVRNLIPAGQTMAFMNLLGHGLPVKLIDCIADHFKSRPMGEDET
jgi:hypothetical protein